MILALCTCAFVACGGDTETDSTPGTQSEVPSESESESESESNVTPTTATYTVTVVDTDGNAIPTVALKIGTKLGATNAQGKASATLDVATYTVTIIMADGYDITTNTFTFAEGETELTVVLEKKASADNRITYTVKVVDENGVGIEGVSLQLCQGACNILPTTNSEGISTVKLAENEYNLQILEAEGYIVPDGYIATIPVGQTEITVTLTAIS